MWMSLDNGYQEDLGIEVIDYEYEPGEARSWDSPGSAAYAYPIKLMLTDEYGNHISEVCILPEASEDFCIKLLELIEEPEYDLPEYSEPYRYYPRGVGRYAF